MCSSVFFSSILQLTSLFFFFFNDTATTEIYTLSLHDALPISVSRGPLHRPEHHFREEWHVPSPRILYKLRSTSLRSEEHTSELQSQSNLVCRLLLEKKKKKQTPQHRTTKTNQTATLSPTLHTT